MGSARVVMLKAGYDAYRNSPEVVALLEELASHIQERAQANVDGAFSRPFASPGPDITVETVHNPSRAVTFVSTATLKGHTAEHVHRSLNRAVQG